MARRQAPFGSWASPQSAQQAVAAGVGIGETAFDGEDALWLEQRPSDEGRSVVVRRRADGPAEDLFAAPFNARSRVHEYGGAAWLMHDGVLFFSNDADQRIHRVDPDRAPVPITPDTKLRFADFCFDGRRQWLWCVREDHRSAGEPRNALVKQYQKLFSMDGVELEIRPSALTAIWVTALKHPKALISRPVSVSHSRTVPSSPPRFYPALPPRHQRGPPSHPERRPGLQPSNPAHILGGRLSLTGIEFGSCELGGRSRRGDDRKEALGTRWGIY